jgi:hypothetical protein
VGLGFAVEVGTVEEGFTGVADARMEVASVGVAEVEEERMAEEETAGADEERAAEEEAAGPDDGAFEEEGEVPQIPKTLWQPVPQ